MMPASRSTPLAFTIVEAMVSIVVVALMLGAALTAAGAARTRQEANAARAQANWLAQSLMAEILAKPYTDPQGLNLLGLEVNELLTLRSSLDDVDDYDGLTENPPKNPDGTSIAGYTGWSRTASVANVLATNFATTSLTDTNYKRVTVTVKKGRQTMAQLTALRTKARDSW
ncbi:MAG TPA: hypothetical protein VD997_11460 [Phycisphaerales bacterium]|nr:hypothetical protein [Phycisphaerales bacterium]